MNAFYTTLLRALTDNRTHGFFVSAPHMLERKGLLTAKSTVNMRLYCEYHQWFCCEYDKLAI